jgi:hypothetical protein
MSAPSEREHIITRALGALTPDLVAAELGDWRFVLENGAKVGVRARVVDQWLELTASATAAVSLALPATWSTLRYNTGLNGAVRVALAPGAGDAHLRGEIFAEDDVHLDTRVSALCEEARAAFHALHGRTHPGRSSPGADPTEVARTPRDGHRLVQLCTEAGWPYTERASGRVEVAIECGPAVYPAQLGLTDDGALSAVVDLVDASTLTPTSRAATALLLLTASAVVRCVKGVVVKRDGVEHAGLAAACERPRSAADLDRALAALSVACGLAGREAQALRHQALAHEYLAWRAPVRCAETPDAIIESNEDDHDNQYEMEERSCLQQL